MTTRKRLDVLVVEIGLIDALSKARALIIAGNVIVNDKRVDKPGTLVNENAKIRLRNVSLPFVSRGGTKLKAAIDKWSWPLKGAVCIDIGSSTGGFTDVLLQEGAQKVFAVDVGYNQLAYSLRIDPRVQVMERTHVLDLELGLLKPGPSVAVVDVSFISLTKILRKVTDLIVNPGIIYALIKPQFEVESEYVEKGGIVRDKTARLDSVHRIIALGDQLELQNDGFIESPIKGADGNVEYLTAFKKVK